MSYLKKKDNIDTHAFNVELRNNVKSFSYKFHMKPFGTRGENADKVK